jgi:plastocyanin
VRPISILPAVLVAAIVAIAAVLLAHGASRAVPSAAGSDAVVISNYSYAPVSATVKVGTTITFTNDDAVEHTATSDTPGVFDTGTLNKGNAAHVKLNKLGTFSYHCSFHAFMHGAIKVIR